MDGDGVRVAEVSLIYLVLPVGRSMNVGCCPSSLDIPSSLEAFVMEELTVYHKRNRCRKSLGLGNDILLEKNEKRKIRCEYILYYVVVSSQSCRWNGGGLGTWSFSVGIGPGKVPIIFKLAKVLRDDNNI
jgi:hypothetical protein